MCDSGGGDETDAGFLAYCSRASASKGRGVLPADAGGLDESDS